MLDEELAVTQHSMHEIRRCTVEYDQIDTYTELLLEIGSYLERIIVERTRSMLEPNRKIDVARGRRRPARTAPEEVGRHESRYSAETSDDAIVHTEEYSRPAERRSDRILSWCSRSQS